MSQKVERKRLDAYVDDYKEEVSEGMSLQVENYEGGGNNMPDEPENYESRLEWLESTDGGQDQIWRTLAEGEYDGRTPDDDEELVFMRFPHWFLEFEDKEDWRRTFGEVYGYHEGWAMLRPETCEGKDAWAFSQVHVNGRWRKPHNQYGMLWGPRACFTLYRREGEPRPTDEARIRRRDALPDSVEPFEADEDDYDWRLALGAAYRRTEGKENDPLSAAYEEAQELPEKLYKRVEIGVDEYMRLAAAEGKEVTDDDLAIIVRTHTAALEPGATVKREENEE